MKNVAIIGLGSNSYDSENLVAEAIEKIKKTVETSRFSSCYQTAPVCAQRTNDYTNCVAVIETEEILDDLKARFKQMETEAGRTPQSKLEGVIPLDIDVLQWNGEILKVWDMAQKHVQVGLDELQA